MIRRVLFLCWVLLMACCAFDGNKPSEAVDEKLSSKSGYRYVSVAGEVRTSPNTLSMGDFTGIAFEYSGDYSFEFWFPMEGGKALQQRCSIKLTSFKDRFFGEGKQECAWLLDKTAFEPVPLFFEAELVLGAYTVEGKTADDFVCSLPMIPHTIIKGTVTCSGVPAEFTDPTAFPQMLAWFQQTLSKALRINAFRQDTVDTRPFGPIALVGIPKENTSYVFVPDLDTP